MSKTIKIEIEIPAPPEGWGGVVFRRVTDGETGVKFWDGSKWANSRGFFSAYKYPVARKVTPLWTPPPQWRDMFGDGWMARDLDGEVWFSRQKPEMSENSWESWDYAISLEYSWINQDMLPPLTIPWDKCCFKIGEPDE